MDVSVVIPTFNRAKLLRRTIAALACQQTRGFSYEVILVSNGSSDETECVLREASAQYPGTIRYTCIPPSGGPAAPRNAGIRAATGAVVIILDDDVLPDSDLVYQHAEFHRRNPEPHRAALGEVYVPPDLLADPMSLFHEFPYHEVRQLERLSYLHFWTCNVSLKREFMLRAGMFDEQWLAYEDMLCGYRLIAGGMHLSFLPAARGQHLHQMKPAGLAAKGQWYGRWLYRFAQERPDPAVMARFGILSPALGPRLFAVRLVKRIALRAVNNPLTYRTLEMLGASSGKRSRLSDLYYYLIFRSNILAGYAEARKLARRSDSAARRAAARDAAGAGETIPTVADVTGGSGKL